MPWAMAQGLAVQADGMNCRGAQSSTPDKGQRRAGKAGAQLQVEREGRVQCAAGRMTGYGTNLSCDAAGDGLAVSSFEHWLTSLNMKQRRINAVCAGT